MFSQYVAHLLILLILSFTEKFLILTKSNLSVISFMNYAFGVVIEKPLPYSGSSRFSLMLPSKHFRFCSSHLNL